MINNSGIEQIEQVKIKIIDTTLLVGSTLGLLSYLLSLFQIPKTGFQINHIVDLIIISSFIILSFVRKKTALKIKYLAILLGLFAFVIIDVIQLGLYSDNKLLLILIPFYTLLVFSFRKTILIYLLGLIIFAFIGFLHINNHLQPTQDMLERSNEISVWVLNGLIITMIAFIIVVISRQFISAYSSMVTDLKKKTETIASQESYYRQIFNSSNDVIFIHDINGNILDANDAMLNMYGYTHQEIIELTVPNISSNIPPYTPGDALSYLKLAAQGIDQKFDWQAKKKNGKFVWVEVILKRIDIGADKRIIGVVRDINEKKQTELILEEYRDNLESTVKKRTSALEDTNEALSKTNLELNATVKKLQKTQSQLIQSEKMASLGTMASGIAHEINNPLNYILGGSTRMEFYVEDNLKKHSKALTPMLNDIKDGVNRASNIVSSLGNFSRQTQTMDEVCDILAIIKNCLTITKNHWKHNFEIIEDYGIYELKVIGNEGQLHQVFLNILTNAFQAMGNSGKLKIKTFRDSSGIHIQFKDNGTGIKEEFLNKVTDPFFTTKEPGKGTGLGMSISYSIIQEHHGNINYTSEENKGTTVSINLPSLKK